MAALSAVRYNPVGKALYRPDLAGQRENRPRPRLIAVAHKLLTIANAAMVHNRTPGDI